LGKIVEILKGTEDESRGFICPGCGDNHSVRVKGENGPVWGYNWNDEKPTFSPSLLVKCGHYADGHIGPKCWCTWNQENPKNPGPECYICHSFIRDGKIQFLNDCTHKLAGKTIDLFEILE